MAKRFSFPKTEYLLIGIIAKAHGMRGEVKIFSYSGRPENIASYKKLVLVDDGGNLSPDLLVLKSRARGKVAIVQLATVDNRDHAEDIEGMGVLLAKEDLPDVSGDEFYWHELQGKTVIDQDGRTIGEVVRLFSNGGHDIMVVEHGENEILIPAVRDIMVSETAENIFISPPPGLLVINEESRS